MDFIKKILKRLIKIIIGVSLLPILYVRYSPIITFFITYLIKPDWMTWDIYFEFSIIMSLITILVYGFIMTFLLNIILTILIFLFSVDYNIKGEWLVVQEPIAYSTWYYPIIEMNGKIYKHSYIENGGTNYSVDTKMKRRMLFTYLFN